ncbi:hypothetical protein [Sphingobium sp. CR28]|uniref:hypothetical protein n=1 Tax=Sphingobium sp. CR28 TaxID=3400272 RepID=UPI003FF12B86
MIAFYRYNYNPDPIVAQYNKEIAGVLLVEEDGEMERKGIANITFRFGDLFVQVLLTRQPENTLRGLPGYAFNIHPSANHLLRWPPLLRLDVSNANMLQHLLEATARSRGLIK